MNYLLIKKYIFRMSCVIFQSIPRNMIQQIKTKIQARMCKTLQQGGMLWSKKLQFIVSGFLGENPELTVGWLSGKNVANFIIKFSIFGGNKQWRPLPVKTSLFIFKYPTQLGKCSLFRFSNYIYINVIYYFHVKW